MAVRIGKARSWKSAMTDEQLSKAIHRSLSPHTGRIQAHDPNFHRSFLRILHSCIVSPPLALPRLKPGAHVSASDDSARYEAHPNRLIARCSALSAIMILLGTENIIIRDVLTEKFERPASVDQTFTDFDGVAYHLESTGKAGPLTLSMDIRCWSELVQAGALDVLKREYGPWIRDTVEPEYSVTLEFDFAKVPAAGPERDALIANVSLLKRNAMAAPFERAFAMQKKLESESQTDMPSSGTEIMPINYRDDEAIYVIPSADRVTVVFTTTFKDETDKVLGKVFLQEFVDARRQPSIQGAPQVIYSNREPPLEVRNVQGLNKGEDVGYVTFVLFPRHFSTEEVAAGTISRIQLFRDYLHYHIKCSKAYMHSRMRHRVAEFIKVLNRAKPELAEKERKTASGRTFRRA